MKSQEYAVFCGSWHLTPPELNPEEKNVGHFKGSASMVAYNNIEILQAKISGIVESITTDSVRSICGNQFHLYNFKVF